MENLWKTFDAFGIYLEKNQVEQLQIHFDLLMRWKEVHNLTTIGDPKKIFLYHYVDSILGLKALETSPLTHEIYDLGSGAGFPGLVAAVLWPDKDITLVETSKKKCSFLRLAASSMRLNRVKVLDQRVETLRDVSFAISRAAFSPGNWSVLDSAITSGGQIAFWLSDKETPNSLHWVLDKQSYYELEPGNRRQIAVFRKI
ncbi:MAG: RsmG family class I SAM-dependent methyltransferase [Myxococcaceae bacterium]